MLKALGLPEKQGSLTVSIDERYRDLSSTSNLTPRLTLSDLVHLSGAGVRMPTLVR